MTIIVLRGGLDTTAAEVSYALVKCEQIARESKETIEQFEARVSREANERGAAFAVIGGLPQ